MAEPLKEEIEEEVVEVEDNEETVALAKSMGWVEQEKFRGDTSNWVNADTFVEKGMNDLPILRERVRSQSKKLHDMESDITEFKAHHEKTAQREHHRAVQELEAKQLAAVETADTEEYQRIQKQKQSLSPPVQQKTESPLYADWKEKNADWFEKDSEMTVYANRMSDYIAETRPTLIGNQEFLDEVENEVKLRFKDKFENTNRESPNTVESGGRAHRPKGGKTYSELPADAKAACDKFVRRGLTTKEQYVQDYEWS